MSCSLVVGTGADLESSGHLLSGEVQLNGCCTFPIWRRGGDMAVQVTSRCQSCLGAIRSALADPAQTQLVLGGKVKMVVERRDPAAPSALLLALPSARIVAH